MSQGEDKRSVEDSQESAEDHSEELQETLIFTNTSKVTPIQQEEKYLLINEKGNSDDEERIGPTYQVTSIVDQPWVEKVQLEGGFSITTREKSQALRLRLKELEESSKRILLVWDPQKLSQFEGKSNSYLTLTLTLSPSLSFAYQNYSYVVLIVDEYVVQATKIMPAKMKNHEDFALQWLSTNQYNRLASLQTLLNYFKSKEN